MLGGHIPFMPRDVTPWLTALRAYSVFDQLWDALHEHITLCTYLNELPTIYLLV